MDRKRTIKGIAVLFLALIILALLILGFRLVEKLINKSGSVSPEDAFSYSGSHGEIEYNGTTYLPNNKIKSILFLGIDSTESPNEDRADSQQSDFVVLVVVDDNDKSFRALHINRDTMTGIREIDRNGKAYGEFEGQLALAHTYGSDEGMRCRNTVAVTEQLLYGIEIDHYISITMDAVPILNDSVGGVTLTLLDDFTHVDPSFTKGAKVTLMGEHALSYVRERGALEDSSNLSRMERQKQYVSELLERYNAVGLDETSGELILELGEHIAYDYSAEGLSNLVDTLSEYTYKGTLTLSGEAVKGEEYMEYYIDEQAARQTVIDLFYTPKK